MIVVGFVIAASLGAIIRWQGSRLNDRDVPLGTLGVNLSAAFAAGLATSMNGGAATVFVVAFLGSTSTFSTVMGEIEDRLHDGRRQPATVYAVLTIIGGVGTAALGLAIAS